MAKGSLVFAVIVAACAAPKPSGDAPLLGSWHVRLASPGGPLPFRMTLTRESGGVVCIIENGEEQIRESLVRLSPETVVIDIAHYDASLSARLQDGDLVGEWKKTVPNGTSRLALRATRGRGPRFAPRGAATDVAGRWNVTFQDDDATFPAVADFTQDGTTLRGTFRTATGDYRYLAGDASGGSLRLSTFDGAHAFLFEAALQDGTLKGSFWSRDAYHATWTATRLRPNETGDLPDPAREVQLLSQDGRLRFAFVDADGHLVSSADPRFRGKVLVVDIFGTWCPNCNDQAPVLARWHRRWAAQGLEIVGLAYEFTGDTDRDRDMLERYRRKHRIEFPLLLAGTSDKSQAAKTLPDLSAIKSYPTTVFIGRDGRVRRIHSGFAGPGTGLHHEALLQSQETLLRELLGEPPPG